MVEETKPLEKTCSRCDQTKLSELFILKRNICRECNNMRRKELYDAVEITEDATKICNICNESKSSSCFSKKRQPCNVCNNKRRRNQYHTDNEHRLKLIQQASVFKHKKIVERQLKKLEEIGENNKKCSKCNIIKIKECFRYNRLKCKDCERDEPIEKFKRSIRGRIHIALKSKSMHTIEYLGATPTDYLKWILNNNNNYTLENRGTEWHIDHVIPLSHFDLDDELQQRIAFNWRNTMPFSASENLKKNNKILKSQLEQHIQNLKEYHEKNKIHLPQTFIDLFAKHLDAGNPLEPLLPLSQGNLDEELG